MLLSRNGASRYLLILLSNFVAMIIGFMINIYGTKVMQTETYGFFRAFLNTIQLQATIFAFGFQYTYGRMFAFGNKEYNKKTINTAGLVTFIVLSFVSACAVFLLAMICFFCGQNRIPNYILFAAPFVYLVMFQFYLQQKFQGEGDMVNLSIFNVLSQLLFMFFLLYAYNGKMILNIKIVLSIYVIINTLIMIYMIIKGGLKIVSIKEIKKMNAENKYYGFQIYLGALSSVGSALLITLSIAPISGLTEYGFFSLGLSLASPIAVVASTMGVINFKRNVSRGKLHNFEIGFTLTITVIASVVQIYIINFIMPLFIANKYYQSFKYANILIIVFVMMGIGDYFNKYVGAKGEGAALRNCAFLTGGTLILSAVCFIPKYKIIGLIVSRVFGAFVYMTSMLLIYYKITKHNGGKCFEISKS